jgi:hypothetical protein
MTKFSISQFSPDTHFVFLSPSRAYKIAFECFIFQKNGMVKNYACQTLSQFLSFHQAQK